MKFYAFAKFVMTTFFKIKGCRVQGLDNVPSEGPFIVACNHISFWDPLIVACALPRPVTFMAKEELFKFFILRKIVIWLGAFPVKRGQGDIGAIRKSLAVLRDGKILGIFPEGTRSKTGEIQEAMTGIALIMEKSKAPILPVKVYNSKRLLRQKRGTIGIIIGKPIYASSIKIPENIDDRRLWLANHIMKQIDNLGN